MKMGLIVVGALEHGSDAQWVIRPSWFVDSLDQMVDAVDTWQFGILNETGWNNSAEFGGQKFENLPTLGTVIVHGSCRLVWHLQSQDVKFNDRLHVENSASNCPIHAVIRNGVPIRDGANLKPASPVRKSANGSLM